MEAKGAEVDKFVCGSIPGMKCNSDKAFEQDISSAEININGSLFKIDVLQPEDPFFGDGGIGRV